MEAAAMAAAAAAAAAVAEADGEAQEPIRLKQWPGKDAVQALAVWWMAAALCEGHQYTEPELYAVRRRRRDGPAHPSHR